MTTAIPAHPIEVVVVHDKPLLREGIGALLEREPGFRVIARAATVGEASALEVRPDVVITDLVLPDARGAAVVAGLRGHFTHAALFALIAAEHAPDPDLVSVTAAGGIEGCASLEATADEFLAGLRAVAQGIQYVQPSLRARGTLLNGSAQSEESGAERDRLAFEALTDKEREVLRFLVLGHTNAEIATLCRVSLRTVETRRARLLRKLDVRTRAELVRIARNVGHHDPATV